MTAMTLWEVRRRIRALHQMRLGTGSLGDDDAAELAALYAEEERLVDSATTDDRVRPQP